MKQDAMKKIEKAQQQKKISFEDNHFDAQAIRDMTTYSAIELISGKNQ